MNPPLRSDEFPADASVWPEGLDRREFLQLAAASAALAGLPGCARPGKVFVPYVSQPDGVVPGRPSFYATAAPFEGYARGVLVESREGRPIKIEGNPLHAESCGATDAATQASVLSLYDPERSRSPRFGQRVASWAEFDDAWFARREELLRAGGAGLALLTEPTTSPSLIREIHGLLERFPQARWFQHTALPTYEEDGVQPDIDLGAAEIVFSIDADFLHGHPSALRHARAFGRRRRGEGGRGSNRLYAIESGWSITGAMADHRLAVRPSRIAALLNAVAEGGADSGPDSLSGDERAFVSALVRDLRAHAPRVACVAGPEQDPEVRRWARAMNGRLGALGGAARLLPPVRSDSDSRCAGNLEALAGAIGRNAVSTLVIAGCNPVQTAPADLDFSRLLGGVALAVHLGLYADETALLCHWHLPEAHFLEAWGDLRGFDGSSVIQQPLIEPLHGARSALEVVRRLSGFSEGDGYSRVRETWKEALAGANPEEAWTRWLNRGVATEAASSPAHARAPDPAVPRLSSGPVYPLELVIRRDPILSDGRFANNGWLQELPKPFTSLTWDNAALMDPALAARHALKPGDVVTLTVPNGSVQAPVWILPGQAEGCVVVHLGGGRSRAGAIGNHRGFDAFRIRLRNALWHSSALRLHSAGSAVTLASTQHHFEMAGRDLARITSAADPSAPTEPAPAPSLYPPWPGGGHAWGMTIDLSSCIGCSACVAACQAENNTPVVGKDQVLRGREMHWIRVDRYFAESAGALRVVPQPVPCMHCEQAPCEPVCPVAATVHSSEGLNEMVYNRCVGTRYCSNNCPYKVRRFNFLDFREPAESPLHLRDNPEVTVRSRGVMEKCTYCVQRISAGRSAAEREGRSLRDGEIRTACQQACPAEAIVFGDLSDPESAVSRKKREPGHYALLAELNTRPRTTYQPKRINPA